MLQALLSRVEQQEEARLLLQEKDQYREQVRTLTEQSDKLELLLLRSQGEELQLRTRLRRLTCRSHQVRGGEGGFHDVSDDLMMCFSFSVTGAVRRRRRRSRSLQRMQLKVRVLSRVK